MRETPAVDRSAHPPVDGPPTVDLLGLRFHAVTEAQCVEHVLREVEAGRGGWVVTPNLDIVRMASSSREIWDLVARADLVLADGMPVVWASRLLGRSLPERVAGSSLVSTLTAGAAGAGRSVYLLGGDPGTAEGAAQVLRGRHPTLRVAGTECPPRGFDRDPALVRAIADRVRGAGADVVFVGLGFPKQERLIERIRPAAPRAWYLGVGISFSYLSGEVRRAPAWMRRSGLEWVARLAQEPRRLARRYLREDLPFVLRLGSLAARARFGARLPPGGRLPTLEPRARR
jgi:N-acetylglucosaminyldiphosphoundecaprenol N-acetyl-beta-D-mannosaminyltransferase